MLKAVSGNAWSTIALFFSVCTVAILAEAAWGTAAITGGATIGAIIVGIGVILAYSPVMQGRSRLQNKSVGPRPWANGPPKTAYIPEVEATTEYLPDLSGYDVILFNSGDPVRTLATYLARSCGSITVCGASELTGLSGDIFVTAVGKYAKVWSGNPVENGKQMGLYKIPPPPPLSQTQNSITTSQMPRHMPTRATAHAETSHVCDDRAAEDAYRARYTPNNNETLDLANLLAREGYGIGKISRALPFASDTAREVARDACNRYGGKSRKPEGQELDDLILQLSLDWGMPIARIAKLLDGNENANEMRVRRVLK